MKRFILLFLLSIFIPASAQIKLSDKAEISVLTIDSGKSLNDAFGHSAFRIKDKQNNIDVTFDYGRFDFDAPNFYLNFARGKLNYSIGSSNYYDFYSLYKWQNRSIKEQILNLTQFEKQKLFTFLIENYKPENREYLYDFFYDNCATKMKDVVNEVLYKKVNFETPKELKEATFRTLIQNKLNKNSWGSLGIDIALGSVIDKKASPQDHMFLPENIYKFFENANYNKKPLVKESKVVFEKKEETLSSNFFISPLFIFGLLSLIILYITYKDYKNYKRSKWLDVFLFLITGFIGVMILLLWFATDHAATAQNYNLLWAFALNLIVISQVIKVTPKKWFIRYLKFLIIMLLLLTFHWIVGIQVFAIGLFPLLIALGVRYVFLLKHYNTSAI